MINHFTKNGTSLIIFHNYSSHQHRTLTNSTFLSFTSLHAIILYKVLHSPKMRVHFCDHFYISFYEIVLKINKHNGQKRHKKATTIINYRRRDIYLRSGR